ncbi:Ribosome maturation factor RimM [Arsenophonus endosymbiont of Aleurodicus dispersus]|uniref:ribosome maturation factor RimM n=1 Tax=Arsenophonus endosymbiont of Aleurodicus dispersus TaxID=235559 RepID=UPI000EB4C0F4|nr:ribosome maturation factor RimM [Arsenophonus endosymbiont of Aleurodicus dispersus]VAY02366.1 Ribosome maturation factor RimM [Arsenophonus endosymbiont of Aleurodicus dispersus]
MSKEVYNNNPINHPIILGKLGSAYGLSGWIRIFSSTEYAEDIFEYQPWFLQGSGKWQRPELEGWKQHNKNIIIKIKHIDDRSAANSITNCKIIVNSAQLPILEGDEYYWNDLIGCQVITTKGYSLGYVRYLIETGTNDVLVIKANLKDTFGIKERLIPFINKQVIKNVDLIKNIIEVYWDPNFKN